MENPSLQKYQYRAFGLNIHSDFELDGALTFVGKPDIVIVKGQVPEEMNQPVSIGSMDEPLYQFCVRNTARCLVTNGNKILIEPQEGVSASSLKLVILGSALSVVMFQRGNLPIHGSAMLVRDKCIVISGESGAGKTSLTLAFRRHGHSLMSDDVSVMTFDCSGQILVESAIPQQKIWKDTAEKVGFETDGLQRVLDNLDKFLLPVDDNFHSLQHPLYAIFVLCKGNQEAVTVEKVSGARKLEVIMKNTYRGHFAMLMGIQDQHFRMCSEVAKKIPVYRIVRPEGKMTTDQQMMRIMEVIGEVFQ